MRNIHFFTIWTSKSSPTVPAWHNGYDFVCMELSFSVSCPFHDPLFSCATRERQRSVKTFLPREETLPTLRAPHKKKKKRNRKKDKIPGKSIKFLPSSFSLSSFLIMSIVLSSVCCSCCNWPLLSSLIVCEALTSGSSEAIATDSSFEIRACSCLLPCSTGGCIVCVWLLFVAAAAAATAVHKQTHGHSDSGSAAISSLPPLALHSFQMTEHDWEPFLSSLSFPSSVSCVFFRFHCWLTLQCVWVPESKGWSGGIG